MKPLGRIELFWMRWRAKALLTLGMRQAALQIFRDIHARMPQDVHAINSIGYAELQSGHPAQALPWFERALTLTPDLSNSHYNVAFVCEELGRLDEAERGFRAALEIEEKMDRAWYGLGLVLVRQGRLEEALKVLRKNTKLQPMSPYGWYQIARVHVDLKQPDEAVKVIRHLKGFEPKVAAQLERETGLSGGQAG